ncbi:potassium channel family protein [Tropicimonas sp. IMCC34043]|uniref:potassium channel family protein n=1 Tax=Tropicimonas sp. IMCC34043 TaxID=2248760 RepID=UPI0018E5535F|nr:potassium channel family protein [Tropicimonas sp. IMCC34043]
MLAIFVGTGVSLLNIAVHGLLTVAMVSTLHARAKLDHNANAVLRVIMTMVVAAAILMAAHIIEVWLWSVCYQIVGVTPDGEVDFTFAFVNYTTLGYGNVVPVPPWKVIGPMTAMNGVLLFGWSTAVLFQVLSLSSRQFGIKY